MEDRCGVLTTRNGQTVEWKVFDTASQAMPYYVSGMAKLQGRLNRVDCDGEWEIMFCKITQYALSK